MGGVTHFAEVGTTEEIKKELEEQIELYERRYHLYLRYLEVKWDYEKQLYRVAASWGK